MEAYATTDSVPVWGTIRLSGLVANLMSVSALPQADEDTSHRKANTPVTKRS